ncbi:MAG: hypothetical protein ACR2P2_08365 [Nakamurella sp.]
MSALVSAHFRGIADPSMGRRWLCEGAAILRVAAFEVALWPTDGSVEALGPDRCRLVMGAWSWAGLAASIARADADIEAVEPSELACAFTYLSRRAATAAGKS